MGLRLLRSRALQAYVHASSRASAGHGAPKAAAAGARCLSSSPTGMAGPAVPPPPSVLPASERSQLHRGAKGEGQEKRRLWPYLKAARQQFFNVILSSLAIVMSVKMLQGKGARVELEEQVVELERRENVLIQALSDETWAEDVAERIGAKGGKDAVLREVGEVVKTSQLDKETAQLSAMRSAALKASEVARTEDAHMEGRDSDASSAPRNPASRGMM